MRVGAINKNRPETNFVVVSNRETTAIPAGTPVCFVFDGTDDGLAVQLPSSSNASKSSVGIAGIASGQGSGALAASSMGQVIQVYGICNALVASVLTRSASSAVWASAVGSTIGDVLTIDTVGNVLVGMSAGSLVKAIHPFVLAQSVVSRTTAGSGSSGTYAVQNTNMGGASTDTIAYVTSLAKVFVRCM